MRRKAGKVEGGLKFCTQSIANGKGGHGFFTVADSLVSNINFTPTSVLFTPIH